MSSCIRGVATPVAILVYWCSAHRDLLGKGADGDEDATAEVFYEKVSQLLKATGGDVDTATLARRWKKVSLCLSLSACVCGRPPPNISIMIADTALRVRHVVLDACNF